MFDAGIGIYDQEYTELYQPEITGQSSECVDLNAIRNARTYNAVRQLHRRLRGCDWQARRRVAQPADHFSLLRTYSGSVSYVTGSHSFKFGAR